MRQWCKLYTRHWHKIFWTIRDATQRFFIQEKSIDKKGKCFCNLNDKKSCVRYQKFEISSKIWTKARKNSKNDFQKDFCKLLNNSVFGEILEDAQRRGE